MQRRLNKMQLDIEPTALTLLTAGQRTGFKLPYLTAVGSRILFAHHARRL